MRLRSPCTAFAVLTIVTTLLAVPVGADAQSRSEQARDRAERALDRVERLAEDRSVKTGRELTLALLQLARQRPALSRTDQQAASRFFARPTDGGDMDEYEAPSVKSCTDHFCVHWVESGNDAPDMFDGPDACVTPDYIDAMHAAFERSFAIENGTLGWRAPVSDGTRGGDARTDVYVTDLNPPEDNTGLYGYANPEQTGRTSSGYLVLDDDYAADEFDDYGGAPIPPMQVTAAHEYNHLLQFAYDLQQDLWMYESTATWSEEKVFPAVDDYLFYLPTFAQLPQQPITSSANGRQYGSAVWNHYLDAKYGPEVVRDAWARSALAANSVGSLGFAPKAYDAAIKAEGGEGFSPNFGDFTAATAEWQAANSGFPDASRYPDVRREIATLQLATPTPVADLDHTGYRLFNVPLSTAARLELNATMASNVAGTFALVGDDGGQMTRVVSHVPTGGSTALSLPDPGRFERITAVVTNADTKHSGFNTLTGDWNWSSDNRLASIEVTEESAAARLTSAAEPQPSAPLRAAATTIPGESTFKPCNPAVEPTPTPTASPTATPTVTATPTPQPPVRTSLTLSRSSTRIRTVVRTGKLSLFARTNKAGRLSARSSVDRATARRLRIGRRTTSTGTGRRTATAPSRLKINVKLTRKARAALKRQRSRTVRIKVRVTLVPADGTAAVTRAISLLLRP